MPFWTSSGVLELRDYVPRLTHTPLSAAAPRGSPRCRIAAHHGLGRRVGERVLAGRADAPLLHVRVRRRRRGAAQDDSASRMVFVGGVLVGPTSAA